LRSSANEIPWALLGFDREHVISLIVDKMYLKPMSIHMVDAQLQVTATTKSSNTLEHKVAA
jgi:hypothetical protein